MAMKKKTILVLGFGGTVAGVGKPNKYKSGILSLEEVFLPVFYDKENITLELRQISYGDGVDKSGEEILRLVWEVISGQDLSDVDAVLALMGTDMIEVFTTVCSCFRSIGVPFIITGAQLPATTIDTDGSGNIGDGIMVCMHPESQNRGTMLVFHNKIMCGPSIRKRSVSSNDAFESLPDTIGHVKDGFVSFNRSPNSYPTPILITLNLSAPIILPQVKIETLTNSYNASQMKTLIEHNNVKAFVFVAMGNGYSNPSRGGIKNLLEEHDMIAVVCTNTGEPLPNSNADFGIPGGYLPMTNLQILLQICLFTGISRAEIEKIICEWGRVSFLQDKSNAEGQATTRVA